jgi:hypothetical protein
MIEKKADQTLEVNENGEDRSLRNRLCQVQELDKERRESSPGTGH